MFGVVIFMFMMNMVTELIYFALILEELRKRTAKKGKKKGKTGLFKVVLDDHIFNRCRSLKVDRVKENNSQTPTGIIALFDDEWVLYIESESMKEATEAFWRLYENRGQICH